MKVPDAPEITPADAGPDRAAPEAPAAVVSICRKHIRLLLALGIGMAGFAVMACVIGLEVGKLHGLGVELEGIHEESLLPQAETGSFILGALAALNAIAILHYGLALRQLRRDRRIIVLHRAMRRMRMVWFFFGIFLCTAAVLAVRAVLHRQTHPAPEAVVNG